MSVGSYPKRSSGPNKIFHENVVNLEPPTMEGANIQSSLARPADAFAIYFSFLYMLGLCPFKLLVCNKTGTFKVITNWKQKVRDNL